MNTISPLSPSLPLQKPQSTNPVEQSSANFEELVTTMISDVNQAQRLGGDAIMELQSGKAEHLHEVMLAVEKADISMRMLVQIRNRALSAYEEIMRMQI